MPEKKNDTARPIAIIGIGCRFPGRANDPEAYWRLMCDGVDAITEVPADRFDIDLIYDPEPGTPGKTNARWGGFIDGIDQFDAGFFGISPREAARMDPQQRLLLEVAFEAVEDAGQTLDGLAGSNTGVFVGISTNDYAQIQSSIDERDSIDTHSTAGGVMSIAANRISYCFDWKGPSLIADTACSSSLVAVHLACRSIWNQESALALAGGVNVIICPETYIGFSRLSMLSPEGRCKAFDAGADGFVRSEGAGIVVLKPLSRAMADGDHIYAVIRGTAVNQDGRTNGLTVPSQEAQAALLGQVCDQAGIAPNTIQYVEAHGTGTSVGDPIELNALGEVLSPDRALENRCIIGSVKTNIGHLEAAAGIAGLIKVALSLKHGLIPPNLHFNEPNPLIRFDELKLRVPQRLEPWPENGGPRSAGVNSFGFGGTNAHVLLTDAPRMENRRPVRARATNLSQIVPLSARSPQALKDVARAHAGFLREQANHTAPSLREIGTNLAVRRTHHDHRLSLVAHTKDELAETLEAFLAGETRPGMRSGYSVTGDAPKLAFVFSGQGPQWWAMGRELLEQEPVFEQAIKACDGLLRKHASWSLMEVLTAREMQSRLEETAIAQPAIFALQVALAALWRSWGVEPEAVVGHSVGEVAAAHVAGVLSLEDSVKVIFHRGRCMDLASSRGRMLGVGLTPERIEEVLAGCRNGVAIAAFNSPSSVTLSGDAEALKKVSQILDRREISSSFLRVNYAFHSSQMDPVRGELLAALQDLRPEKAARPMFSTVTARGLGGTELDAEYWWQNVRKPVRFAEAINGLITKGCNAFLELSPHPVLSGYVDECLQARGAKGLVLPSLRRKEPERFIMLSSLGALYAAGHPVDWTKLCSHGCRRIDLPRYPWQHEAYWHESRHSMEARLGAGIHPLLGRRLPSADPAWRVELDRWRLSYLHDHRVQGHTVFPAAGYVEIALAAARELFGPGTYLVEDIEFRKALFIPETGETPLLQTTFYPEESSLRIRSRLKNSDQPWTLHASGKIRLEPPGEPSAPVDHERLRVACPQEISHGVCYQIFQERGLQFGPSFQGLERLWRREGEAVGRVQLPEHLSKEAADYQVHPAVLDACFQVLSGTLSLESRGSDVDVYLPVQIRQIRFFGRPGNAVWSHARLANKSAKALEGTIRLIDPDGNVLMEVHGFKGQSIDTTRSTSTEPMDNWNYEIQWQLKARPEHESDVRPTDFLPSAEEMHARLRSETARLSEALDWKNRYKEIEPDLDRLSSSYIAQALRDLGWDFRLHQRVTIDSLKRDSAVAAQHHRLLARYIDILTKEGWLKEIGGSWEVCRTLGQSGIEGLWKSILHRFPALQAELMLIAACGPRLADVLQGKIDPLHLIFPEGSLTTAEHLYQDAPSSKIYNLLAAKAISLALARMPEGRRVRLLEIGGGTAGLTSYVLPMLPAGQVEYVFSDVSPLFLQRAEQKLRDYPFVKYQLLDIEEDPVRQQFGSHSFDLVLASDVLHATKDLRAALRNVQQILAPGGLLTFLEIDNPARWLDLVFGLTEGWWRFDDADLRPSYPLLDREHWLKLLREIGFCHAEAFSEMDGKDGASMALFVGHAARPLAATEDAATRRRGDATGNSPHAATRKRWLIFADAGGIGMSVAGFFQAKGDEVVLVSPGDGCQRIDDNHFQIHPDSPQDFERLVDDAIVRDPSVWHGVVHCWSLDSPAPDETTLSSLDRSAMLGCHSVMHFIQAWSRAGEMTSVNLWLISRGAQPAGKQSFPLSVAQSPLCGLGRVIINEHQDFLCKMVDLGQPGSPEEIVSLCEELVNGDDEDEVALRGQARYVPRLVQTSLRTYAKHERKVVTVPRDPVRWEITTPGVMENLTLRESKRRKPDVGEIEIQVAAAALNFRDVMKALGIYPGESGDQLLLGDECAGRVVAVGEGVEGLEVGDEVIATAPGCLGSYVTTGATLAVRKPRHLSLEEAVTIPIAFVTAYYALDDLGRIVRGERVLIHAAAGGVGLAAVQVAQQAGAQVFATAGSPEKRAFLRSLGIQYVMDSRSLSFADEIMEATDGKGVDVVLNSLAGDAIQKGLSCLSPHGRFVEIGTRDIYQDGKIGLRAFKNGLSFSAINPQVMANDPRLIRRLLDRIIELFENRQLHPLPYRVFPATEVISAFRHMAQAKHIGKIVVSFRDQQVPAEPRTDAPVCFVSDATYMITGGLGGFGLAVAQWMADNGARQLVLMGRSGAGSEEARSAVDSMKTKGVRVVIAEADVSREEDVARVLEEIRQSLPPLRGIVHSAMVLDDGILLQLNCERFRKVMAPKVLGAWNLHQLTLKTPLDFFVLFSSATTMCGNLGQGNYVAANAFLDALAHYRRRQDLPALTINWGHLSDAGYVARHSEIGQYLEGIGIKGFTSSQAMVMLRRAISKNPAQIGVMNIDWRQWAKATASHSSPRFSGLLEAEALDDPGGDSRRRMRDVVLTAPADNREQLMQSYLTDQVARVLGTSASKLEPERPLNEMGLDSLMMVELKNRVEKEMGTTLSTVELMRGPTISKFARGLLHRISGSDPSASEHPDR